LTCETLDTCQPNGASIKEKECALAVWLGEGDQFMRSYDLPCEILHFVREAEEVVAIEAKLRDRIKDPATPGLAEALQRHHDARSELITAGRALATALVEGADDGIVTRAKGRLFAAVREDGNAWRRLGNICN
jgi:hypothetical protein